MIRVTVWNEYRHEQNDQTVRRLYPYGIHEAIAVPLKSAGFSVQTATLNQPHQGLSDELLDQTDVLIWWGHIAHDEVADLLADRIVQRVWQGMGFIALHSSHLSKPFKRLMGTSCELNWREAGEQELLWVIDPAHAIVQGVGDVIRLEHEETYGEPFQIPQPDCLVFVSSFSGGEVFRSGCTYQRGGGRVFYFRPGHEKYPTYHHPKIQRVIENAVVWASPPRQ
jgi:trehalose utilization protein